MKKLALLLLCLTIVFSLAACGEEVPGPQGEQGIQGPQGVPGKDGVSPTITISEDGYWVINGLKSAYKAVGTDGLNGTDGTTPTIEISADGYWVLNGTKAEYKAVGTDGKDGTDGTPGKDGEDGKDGAPGKDGEDGKDGVTPTIEISADGYWVINGVKTEYKAVGTDGKDGVDGTSPSISIDKDGYLVLNGVKTEYKTCKCVNCDHVYGSYSTYYAATCTAWGIDVRTCTLCGDADYKLVSASEHNYKNTVVAPTCNSSGYTEHVCQDCGKSYRDSETSATTNHSYTSTVVAPTCNSAGYTEHVCQDCGNSYKDNEVSATGNHTFYDLYVMESTCVSRKVLKACSTCNALAVIDEEPTAEHDFLDRVCTVCGELKLSEGLEFTLNWWDEKSYSVSGVGTCTDTDIIIPSVYNNLPVTTIGFEAFEDCDSLTGITIPSSVTSIGNSAFSECDSLTSITIPSSVTSIGDRAFYNCDSLTNITVDENNENYKSIDGNLYTKDGKTLIQYAIGKQDTSFIIPDGVTTIGNLAFRSCDNLTSITIPSSVTSIGDSAFYYCESLYVVYNYSNLSFEIGNSANGHAAYYAKILVNNGVTSYVNDGYEYTLTEDDFLFRCKNNEYELIAYCGTKETIILPNDINGNKYSIYCMRGVTNVVIPNSFTSIGFWAFAYCYRLTSITIPSSVTSIGEGAFSSCYSLTSITIPSSVTTIGDEAFRSCDSLTNIAVDINNQYYKDIDGNLYTKDGKTLIQYAIGKKDTSFIIPDGVTSIGNYAFQGCDSLTTITIPSSVTSIGDLAFYSCDSLTNITVDANNKYYKDIDGNLYTKDGKTLIQYAIGKKDTSFIIPDGVTTIGDWAFGGCRSLTSITIPSSVTSIGNNAFLWCDSLNTVYYTGTESEWNTISIGYSNSELTDATRYYYSETEPTVSGNYWHYVDGKVVVW